jgi:threonylcarbamoyladenosine tRNA methylthiotransferase MtaB
MKRISVVTLGCKVNQYDTAAILNRLPESRYKRVPFSEDADVYVIDTCTVTHKADSEARNYIYRARRANPDGVVVVTGCYAQVSSHELRDVKGVDYIIGNSHKFSSLLKIIRDGKKQPEPNVFVSDFVEEKHRKFESPAIRYFPDRTRAFLKIQDGCNYRCSFCVIPFARGRSRSLGVAEVLERMRTLANKGYKEIVLTGIHLASYGRDIESNLLELLEEIERSKVLTWVRLSSLDPADISGELIEFVASSQTICPSFHVALQSGDSEVLRRMRRRYSPEKFQYVTDLIREKLPDAAIGTDVMVGFPGETDREFENTFELLGESPLTYFHVFPYSDRKGTAAFKMFEKVPVEIKKIRSRTLRDLGIKKKHNFYRGFIGKKIPVIVEKGCRGTSRNYMSVVFPNMNLKIGDEVEVEIKDVNGEHAIGSLRSH